MKEAGTTHWSSPNTSATNTSGFTALAGGYRDYIYGSSSLLLEHAYFWSSTQADADQAYNRKLNYENANVNQEYNNKQNGYSVRLLSDVSLSVGLTSFIALEKNRSIILHWITESELENRGFILEKRESDEETWSVVASYETHEELKGQGNKSSRTEYSFTDIDVESGKEYYYRLLDVSTSGEVTHRLPLYVKTENLPFTTEMGKAYPNPFNPSTKIGYELDKDSELSLCVYDMLGKKVKELHRGFQAAGSYCVDWNGTTSEGVRASNGCYIILMQISDFRQAQKVVMMK